MEIIGEQKIWTYCGSESKAVAARCDVVRKGPGKKVKTFVDLATKLAELQFLNRDYVLLFRGQGRDYRDHDGRSSLKPSIMRPSPGHDAASMDALRRRFAKLARAEAELVREYANEGFPDLDRLRRQQILRWSILQHYEICDTPLLDVTHSLRIAASFATMSEAGEGYIFVLGVPHISGAVTASAEAGLQIVRLASVCPPSAVRPHLQEGYLLGQYPDLSSTDQKELYRHQETDFGRRLIAKFRFDHAHFWFKSQQNFPRVSDEALYPSEADDPLRRLGKKVRQKVGNF
jgi:hypothetical protein